MRRAGIAIRVNTGRLARGFAWVVTSPLRYLIILAWIVGAVATYHDLPGVGVASGSNLGLLAPTNSPALRVEEDTLRLFAVPVLSRTAIVQRNPRGLSAAAQQRVIERALAIDRTTLAHRNCRQNCGILGALPILNTLRLFPSSRERSTTAITYLFFWPSVGLFSQQRLAEQFERTRINRTDDALVGATGVVPARVAESRIIDGALPIVEIATVILIMVIVGLTFRSVGAPLVTLLAAIIAYVLTIHALGYVAGRMNITVPVDLEPLLVVLILAVCTDYAVFFLSGAKRELLAGQPRVAAVRVTTAEFVPIIYTAGLTIVGCTACLALADLGFLRALGPALAIGVALALLVATTLIPACLAAAGRMIFWPSLPFIAQGAAPVQRLGGWHSAVARWLSARRWAALLVAVVCLASLLAAASGLPKMGLGLPLVAGLPSDSEAARAARAAGLGFAPGIVSPTLLLVEQRGILREQPRLARLESLIARQRGVAGVIGPREQPSGRAYGVVFATNGAAARFVIILDAEPYGAPAIATLGNLERRLPGLLRAVGMAGARAGFGGDTALVKETIDRLLGGMMHVAIGIVLVVFLALALLLRSLVAPLYLLLASALAAAAPLGLTVYLFEERLGQTSLAYYVPLGAGVLLIALGSDYNLFVVGRVWEESHARPWREAIVVAVPRATTAISTAAITLAASFALLAIVPLLAFRAFAFAMAVGVIIDAFWVRSYLVLALMSLFGRLSLWPRRHAPSTPYTASAEPGAAPSEDAGRAAS